MATDVQLLICGSHEAVAEVVMAMRQTLYLQVERTERGPALQVHGVGTLEGLSQRPFLASPIKHCTIPDTSMDGYSFTLHGVTDLQSYSRLRASFTIITDEHGPGELAQTISRAHPDVAVAVIFGAWDSPSYRIGQSWSNGVVTRFTAPAPEHLASPPSDGAIQQVEDLALKALGRVRAQRTPSAHGWPRWSLFAHAANAAGVRGLAEAAAAAGGTESMTAALLAETHIARSLGVASWVDTLMFGETPTPEGDSAARQPYTDTHRSSWFPRQQELLSLIAGNLSPGAADHAFATALVRALGNTDTRLQHGLHPIAFLATAAVDIPDDHAAMRARLAPALAAVCDAVAREVEAAAAPSQTPPDEHVSKLHASATAAALISQGQHATVPAAVRCGVDPVGLLRSLDQFGVGEQALQPLRDAFGGYAAFPEGVKGEIDGIGGPVAATYAALATQDAMQQRICASATVRPPRRARDRRGAGV